MLFLKNSSIRKSLSILVILSILPAFAMLGYSALERRQEHIASATEKVALTVTGMAEQQREITRSTQKILTLLSQLPEFQQLNISESNRILRGLVKQNPHYQNLALVALNGDVIASGSGHKSKINLADRKHFQDALSNKAFSVGEFVIARVGAREPVFPAAVPIIGEEGSVKAVLTIVLKLSSFTSYLNSEKVSEGSFVAITDYKGIRLFYYPTKNETNPVGERIKIENWEYAKAVGGPGIFLSVGSDGNKRIFAFEPVRLKPNEPPYIYFWSGIPETHILGPVNEDARNSLLLLALAFAIALFLARIVGEKIIIAPLSNLIRLAEQLSKGNLKARSDTSLMVCEFDVLSHKFNEMADNLQKTNEKLSNLSLIDGLTNIANRRNFDKTLEEEWNRSLRTKRPISLVMVDIDYFKKFNDTYGHLAGDDCLRTIGLVLKNITSRTADLPARYGGEEFALIFPETDANGASAMAELIHDQVAKREIAHKTSDVSNYLTVSIGVATFTNATSIRSPVDLIKVADEQLYKAKNDGRNKTSAIEVSA